MKCPNCGFNSFDYLEECKKCKLPLNPSREHKTLYKKESEKISRKTLTDSISRGETIVEREISFTGPEGKIMPDSARDNLQSSSVDTEPGFEQEIPAYYKQGQRRASQSDAGEGIKSERASQSDAEEINSETHTPNPRSGPGFEGDTEAYTQDPVLFSESNTFQVATNSSEVTDSKEGFGSYNIAGLKLRVAAFAIDLVIVSFMAYLTIGAGFYLLDDAAIAPGEIGRVFLPIYALLFFLASTYFVFLHYYAGRTLGKMAVGIRIISSEGKELGLWESFMRWVGYYISAVFLFAGFIWSVFDRDSQTWHDKIAGTYVVIG